MCERATITIFYQRNTAKGRTILEHTPKAMVLYLKECVRHLKDYTFQVLGTNSHNESLW